MKCCRFLLVISTLSLTACSGSAPKAPALDQTYGSTSEDATIKPAKTVKEPSTTPPPEAPGEILNRDTTASNSTPNLKDAMTPSSDKLSCDDGALDIVGGIRASDDDLVAASTFRIVFDRKHYCTATLIGPHHMVTAAHCFEGVDKYSSFDIGFGPNGDPTDLRVSEYQIHPDYRGMNSIKRQVATSDLADIAILTFRGSLTSAMKPARIAPPSFLTAGMQVVVAGYGATFTSDTARRPLAWVITTLSSVFEEHKEFQMDQKVNKGACYGDSGGPTFLVGAGAQCLQLVGSISGPNRGSVDCDRGGGLSMDLTAYRDWIACSFFELDEPLGYIPADRKSCYQLKYK